MIGKIKNIKPSGYGWITVDHEDLGTTEDFFFHMTAYKGDFKVLTEMSPPITQVGPTVQFKSVEGPKGPRATRVELVED